MESTMELFSTYSVGEVGDFLLERGFAPTIVSIFAGKIL